MAGIAGNNDPQANQQSVAAAVFTVLDIAWGHLDSSAAKAVAATSRSGRQLHSRRQTYINVHIPSPPAAQHSHQHAGHEPTTPGGTRGCCAAGGAGTWLPPHVSGVLDRGARLQALTVRFTDKRGSIAGHQEHEEQLGALLRACRSHSRVALRSIKLVGGVPLSVTAAEAVAAACPQLTSLSLDYAPWTDSSAGADAGRQCDEQDQGAQAAHSSSCLGVQKLLVGVGPRLRELHVTCSAHRWPAEAWGALRHCTGLTALTVEAGWRDGLGSDRPVSHLESVESEACILEVASTLTCLRSLVLHTTLDPTSCTPEALAPHVTSVGSLRALTALTRLDLELSRCYEHNHDSWWQRQREGSQHAAWVEVREAHRTSLLSALRAMPQLQHLRCPTLWIKPSEMASLTSLTTLSLAGLLPQPTPDGGDAMAAAAAAPSASAPQGLAGLLPPPVPPIGGGSLATPSLTASWALPPHLHHLSLSLGASPRVLANLQPPSTLQRISCSHLLFGMSDVTLDDQLLPQTVAAVGAAVRLLSGGRVGELTVVADGCAGPLRPREGAAGGHAEWLGQLGALGGQCGMVSLMNLQLRLADLHCLQRAFKSLRGLQLWGCTFPVSALPCLSGFRRLAALTVDISGLEHAREEEVATAVALLGEQLCGSYGVGGRREWLEMQVLSGPSGFDHPACERQAREALQQMGVSGVSVYVEGEDG